MILADVGEAAPAAVDAVPVRRHVRAAARRIGAFAQQPVHLARLLVHAVPPEHAGETDALVLVATLLGRGERLLLALLAAAAAEAEDQMQRRILLDVVVGQRALVLQLLPREDEPLLIRGDLHLGLHVSHRVRLLHLQRDRLARQRLHEDLHLRSRRSVRQGEPAAGGLWAGLVVDLRVTIRVETIHRLGVVCAVESEPGGRD
jgi:hypothetical protein